jgi:tRNA A-37 threonylcarbamoyl transferase component Bud32
MMKAGLPEPARTTIAVDPDAFVEGSGTETKAFMPGTRLGYFGDYELLAEIARGGMGVVYKARQSSLKRIVAVKMIRSGQLASEVEVRRFQSEAEAAAQLQHPNIVAIHEIGEHQGQQYFSMDFVEGKNLAQIANNKPVAVRSAAEWLMAIAGAVQFAHQRGVLHRDLKPQNIMVDTAGRPRVMDFGLAKTLGADTSLTNTGMIMGSPSYMSPEQALGRNDLLGPASDVYSLGAILFELLTGRPPFRGKSAVDTMSQVVNDEPPPPRSLNAEAPVDLESICQKCLEKDPVRRYPTARELELDLGRFLDGDPVQARPANALRRTLSWFRRHRWVFSAAISALILTLAGLAYGLWEQTRLLIWVNAHPGAVKTPAPHSDDFDGVLRAGIVVILTCSPMAVFLVQKLKGRPSWSKVFALLNPRSPGMIIAIAAYNVFGIAFAMFLVAAAIHAFVWEGERPSWIIGFMVLLLSWGSVNGLMRAMRLQMRIPVEPLPEYKASPGFHSSLVWIFIALVLLLSGLWLLSVPQPFSQDNLRPLVGGLVVGLSFKLGLFLLTRGWPGAFGTNFPGTVASHRAFSAVPRWIASLSRSTLACLAFGILAVDFVFALLVLGTSNSNPNTPHTKGLFICGLMFGGLLTFLARKKKLPIEPRPETKPTPEPLSPEQLVPIHEAIFAGRTNDAFKLYHAANGEQPNQRITDYKNLLKLEAELKLSHPEKFCAEVLDRATRNANRWAWLWRLTIMLAGLALLFLPRQSLGWLVGLLYGLGIGAFIRAMSSNKMAGWKTAYRGMRPFIKFLSWILVAFFAFAIAALFFSLIVHPGAGLGLCAGGLVVGWLLVHWRLKMRKGS